MRERPRTPQDVPFYTLHVVSDSTGGLARHMVETALTQFPHLRCRQIYHIYQGEPAELERTLRSIEGEARVVLVAVTAPGLKRILMSACKRMGIPSFDLLSPLLEFLAESTGSAPLYDVSRIHKVDQDYIERIQALEFTLQHDDSRRVETAAEADVIIVGVSRVSKTPTSVLLGSLGYKVANLTIASELEFPKEIESAWKKTIALTIDPGRLHEIRNRRFSTFKRALRTSGLGDLPYYDLRAIRSEVLDAEKEYHRRGLPVLDVTDLTVEEVAAKIIRTLKVSTESTSYASP